MIARARHFAAMVWLCAASFALAAEPVTPGTAEIEVVAPNGRPLKGATIHAVRDGSQAPELLGETDAQGKLLLPPAQLKFTKFGVLPLKVAHPEYADGYSALARNALHQRVMLQNGAKVIVKIRDAADKPVPHALVKVIAQRDALSTPVVAAEYRCDQSGETKFVAGHGGTLKVHVAAEKFGTLSGSTSVYPDQTRELRVTLEAAKRLQVTLKNAQQQPVAGAEVRLSFGNVDFTATSDAEGRCAFAAIPVSLPQAELQVKHPRYVVAHEVAAFAGEATQMTVNLKDAGQLLVSLVDEAQTPLQADVYATRDALQGFFSFNGKAPGKELAIPSLEPKQPFKLQVRQHGALVAAQELSLEAGATRQIQIKVPATRQLSIKARDTRGVPVGGVIYFKSVDGKLAFKPAGDNTAAQPLQYGVAINTTGETVLRIQPGKYDLTFKLDDGATFTRQLELAADQQIEWDIPVGEQFGGTLQDAKGRPLEGEYLLLVSAAGQSYTASGRAGAFLFSRLGAGELQLYVLDPHAGPVRLAAPVRRNQLDAQIPVVRHEVKGVVRNFDTGKPMHAAVTLRLLRPVEDLTLDFQPPRLTVGLPVSPSGRFKADLAPGVWELRAYPQKLDSSPAVVTVDPNTRELVLPVYAGRTVAINRGNNLNADGAVRLTLVNPQGVWTGEFKIPAGKGLFELPDKIPHGQADYELFAGRVAAGKGMIDLTGGDAAKVPVIAFGDVPAQFTAKKLTATVYFKEPGRDTLELEADLPSLPNDILTTNPTLTLKLGEIDESFALDRKGKSRTETSSVQLKKKGRRWVLGIKLTHGQWRTALANAGLVNGDVVRQHLTLRVNLTVGNSQFFGEIPVEYTAKQNRWGRAQK